MSITIRPYNIADLPRVCAVTVESFDGVSIDRNIERHFGPVGGRDWAERKAREVALDCALQPDGVFVAEADGEVVGYVTCRLDQYARHAVALLQEARQAGFFARAANVQNLKKDPDLDAVRSRDDFKKLVQELEKSLR